MSSAQWYNKLIANDQKDEQDRQISVLSSKIRHKVNNEPELCGIFYLQSMINKKIDDNFLKYIDCRNTIDDLVVCVYKKVNNRNIDSAEWTDVKEYLRNYYITQLFDL